MATVFLNGNFVSDKDATVSAFDAAFQHGVGLFETMLAVRGDAGTHVVHLHEHIERLAVSSGRLALTESLRKSALAEAVDRTVARAAADQEGTERFRVRLTITGGDLNLLSRRAPQDGPAPTQSPTLLIVAQPATQYPAEMFERGVSVSIADWKANPLDGFQGHKTLNYWPRLRELQVAAGRKAAEALVFQVTNHLSGGCVSNALLVKDGQLVTPIARGEEEEVAMEHEGRSAAAGDEPANRYDPPAKGAVIPSPVLPGIVRRWAMDWAMGAGIETQRRRVTIDDVLGAEELLLTNSSWGVLPVAAVESHRIGGGGVGAVGSRLVEAWGELIGSG